MTSQEKRELRINALVKLMRAGKTQAACAAALGVTRWTINKDAKRAREIIDQLEKKGGEPEAPNSAPDSDASKLPEELEAEAELDALRIKSSRGLSVGPQITVVLSRQVQGQLIREMLTGKLNARECAGALSQVESARKNAEISIDTRAHLRKELAEELLSILDRVVSGDVYDKVVKELERVEEHGV